jgi:hypothetical protein
VLPVLNRNLPSDPFRDFRPGHGFGTGVVALVVKGDSPHRTLADLIAAVKREKRPLNIGSYSDGYMLVGAWLGLAAGIEVSHVAYKGGAQLQNDVMGGSLEFGLNDLGGVITHLKDGRLRGLAVTSLKRTPLAPELPTIADTIPGYEVIGWYGLVAPARVPAEIVTRLNSEIVKAMRTPEVQERLDSLGAELSPPGSAQEFGSYLAAQIEQSRQLIKESGAKPD